MLSKQMKTRTINETCKHKGDTGSAGVQFSLLSARIKKLTFHLKKNPKDNHSRLGLLKMVAHRKKIAKYLSNNDEKSLKKLAKKYGFKVG